MSSTPVAHRANRVAASKVCETVAFVLTSEEQSLRSIREATGKELGVEPSVLTSSVTRALNKLIEEGSVERPRRGFYRSTNSEAPEPKTSAPSTKVHKAKEIGRKLEPKAFVPAPAQPVESISTLESPLVDKTVQFVEAKPEVQQQSKTESEPLPESQLAVESDPAVDLHLATESSLAEEDTQVGVLPEVAEHESELPRIHDLPESLSTHSKSSSQRLRGRLQARRDRRWTPEGSMGMQGMVMIVLWFVAAGAVLFVFNNVYGILTAVGLAIVFWLLHIAMKPRAKKHRSKVSSLPSRP